MIQISGLKKIFDQRGIAGLHRIDLSLKSGEIFSVLGPNGSGKSTLLKIIHGDVQSDHGLINSEGSIHLFKPHAPKSEMNVQKFLVDQVNADIDDEKKIQLARDLADIFEFTSQLKQYFSQLSSGQAQKVLVAAELMNRSDILLLDEPFAHLDPFTRENILISLFKFLRQQQTTVIWVTHDLFEAFRFSDKTGVMNFGKWEQRGTPAELLKNPRNLFTAQYVGYKNFLTIRYENDGWQTPWGTLERPSLPGHEALLILPSYWDPSNVAPALKILERIQTASGLTLILQLNGRNFQVTCDDSLIPDSADQVYLKPQLKHSIIIPL